jgi:hypothetical protein
MSDRERAPLSLLAVFAAVFGVLAVFGLVAPEFAALAVPGIGTAVAALVAIRKYELGGRGLAMTGISLSVVFSVLTPVWHVARFQSEAPRGYERIDFASVSQPKRQRLDEFVGKKVCLKGYGLTPRSSAEMTSMNSFLFSPDGDRGRPQMALLVQLPVGETWHWQWEPVAVSGVLMRNPKSAADPKAPKFVLKMHAIQLSRTRFDLAPRAPGSGFC